MHIKSTAMAIAVFICVAGCGEGTTGPKGDPGPVGPAGVLRDLLAHQDCPALQGRRDPLGRTLQRHLLMALSASCVLTAKRLHAERSATKTRCLSSHTVARVEVL
jgi:hypothetical protein